MVNTTHNDTNDGEVKTYVTVVPCKFEMPSRLTIDQKIGILSSDSVLIPITLGQETNIITHMLDSVYSPAEIKQVYLVHLEISKMAVTVYTNEEFAEEKDVTTANDDKDSLNSDELDDDADEFSALQVNAPSDSNYDADKLQRAPTQKLNQIGSAYTTKEAEQQDQA